MLCCYFDILMYIKQAEVLNSRIEGIFVCLQTADVVVRDGLALFKEPEVAAEAFIRWVCLFQANNLHEKTIFGLLIGHEYLHRECEYYA